MEYYIEPAEQTLEVQTQLKAITPESLNPEELTLLDPACGSGHILVEAYDLFKAIYQERGYRARDIPSLILQNNLFGLEIDDRATQLAAFALMMKARADDRRIFSSGIQPHVLVIQDSKGLDAQQITEALNVPILKTQPLSSEYLFEELEEERAPLFSRKNLSVKGDIAQADVAQLIALFEHGKTFGSLIRVPEELAEKLPAIAERVQDVLAYSGMLEQAAARSFKPLIEQSQILEGKYDAVVANPPYMGNKFMNASLKAFGKSSYPEANRDLFAIFTQRLSQLVLPSCHIGLMTPFTWMFISSFELFRKWMLRHHTILTLVQPEYHAFFESAYVPICAFVLKRYPMEFKGTFINLGEFYGEALQPVKTLEAIRDPHCGYRYTAVPENFSKIPGNPIAYWVRNRIRELFEMLPPLGNLTDARVGLMTSDNDQFLRFFWEVGVKRICFDAKTSKEAVESGARWFPHNKGGAFRKWSGNYEYLVDW
jgi:type II restriction/modification system DNA methylase subunit YeeA